MLHQRAACCCWRRCCLPLALRGRASAAHFNGRNREALADFLRARALYEELGLELEAARVDRSLVEVFPLCGRTGEALAAARRARRTFERLGESRLLAQLEVNLGNLYVRRDEYPRARRHYAAARAAFERLEDPVGLSVCDINLGVVEQNANRCEAAEEALEESLAIRRRAPGVPGTDIAESLEALAVARYGARRHLEGLELAEEALALRRRLHGDEHPRVAAAHSLVGALSQALNDIERAVHQSRRALAIEQARVPPDPLRVSALQLDLARALARQPDLGAAEELLLAALAIRRSLLDDRDLLTAQILDQLGYLYRDLGRFGDAERAHSEALAMRLAAGGERDSLTIRSRHALGKLHNVAERHAEAEEHYRAALRASRAVHGDRHPETASLLESLAQNREALGELTEAEELLGEAYAIRVERGGAEHPDALYADHLRARVRARRTGGYAEAEAVYRRHLDAVRAAFGDGHERVAAVLDDLAYALLEQGDLAEAEACAREGLEILDRRFAGPRPDRAALANRLGQVLLEGGDAERAVFYLVRARCLQEELYPDRSAAVGRSLGALAVAWSRLGQLERAEEAGRQALAILAERLGDRHYEVGVAMGNLALTVSEAGRVEESVDLARRFLAIAEEARGPAAKGTVLGAVNLANDLVRTGRADEAAALLERYAAAAPGDGLLLAALIKTRAFVEHGRADWPAAAEAWARAADVLEGLRTRIAGRERERALYDRELQHAGVCALWAVAALRMDRPEDALTAVERGQARPLLDLLARSRRAPAGDETGPVQEALAGERAARDSLAAAELAYSRAYARRLEPGAGEELERAEGELEAARFAAGEAEARVQGLLHASWPEASALPGPAIRAELRPGERGLVYGWSRLAAVALLVPPRGAGEVRGAVLADGEAEVRELAAEVRRAREALRRGEPWEDRLRALGERLAPAEIRAELSGAERLVLVPGGPLAELPLQLLLAPAPGTGPREVVRAPSLTTYLALGKRAPSDRSAPSALVLGDPHFAPPPPAGAPVEAGALRAGGSVGAESELEWHRLRGIPLPPLPGTRVEAQRIAALCRAAGHATRVLLGGEATLARLEAGAPEARLLHVASHGFPGSERRPYDAGLALTAPGVPSADDSGFLTLDRLFRSWGGRLSGCELVVLSACDSQLGAPVGDSRIALPWGFFHAGAPAVVVSLWRVDDRATTLFMERFYGALLGTAGGEPQPAAAALRQAREWLASRSPDEVRRLLAERGLLDETGRGGAEPGARLAGDPHDLSHPRHWAAFVLVGRPD